MRHPILLLAGIIFLSSFQDNRNTKSDRIWDAQIRYMQGEKLIQRGINGRGIRIAVFDGGFPGVLDQPAFKHLIAAKRIVATWNFVDNKADVFKGVSHGTEVLACMAGIMNGRNMGLATDAEYLLALTEEKGEPLREELNWARAVDWAIEHGANIIQSSLGYTYQRYFTEEMDGRHSIAARAAAKAAANGILVVNCNGNEGSSKWTTVVTPADADSILSIGATDPFTGLVTDFSSIGPTADGRIKPNVCAPGIVVVPSGKGGTRIVEGTSFSSPLIAGFAACAWQLNPNSDAMAILKLIEKSGHLYPYYDYAHGFGIPQASVILNLAEPGCDGKASFLFNDNAISVSLPPKNQDCSGPFPDTYLYYHISGPSGLLKRYGVYKVNNLTAIDINRDGFIPGDVFRCSFNGQVTEWKEQN